MAVRTLEYLKTKFETGDFPSSADFTDLIDSCYNGLTALSGYGDNPNLLLSYITNFNYFDSVLATLTASSLYGTSAQYPLFTSTNLSLTADQINVNLNEVEDLIKRSNTKLDVLTAVDFATGLKQDLTNTLLQILTANTSVGATSGFPAFVNQGALEYTLDSVSISGVGVDTIIAGINDDNIIRTTTPGLTSKILIPGSHRVYNVFGISTAVTNQYIQFYDSLTPTGTPISVFFVPANSNFSFDISRGLKFANHLLVVNSLTPVVYTQGNDDLFMTLIHT